MCLKMRDAFVEYMNVIGLLEDDDKTWVLGTLFSHEARSGWHLRIAIADSSQIQ